VSGLFGRLFWRLVNWFDYRLVDARLRIVDALYGSEPKTAADQQRAQHAAGRIDVSRE